LYRIVGGVIFLVSLLRAIVRLLNTPVKFIQLRFVSLQLLFDFFKALTLVDGKFFGGFLGGLGFLGGGLVSRGPWFGGFFRGVGLGRVLTWSGGPFRSVGWCWLGLGRGGFGLARHGCGLRWLNYRRYRFRRLDWRWRRLRWLARHRGGFRRL